MTEEFVTLGREAAGARIYRQRHLKQDGRALFLYGYAPAPRTPLPEADLPSSAGSELRWHPLRQEWAVYAATRQHRTFKPDAAADPLAPSRVGQAGTEIPFEDFELAVFENRFPSFYQAAQEPDLGFTETAKAEGRCEVIVYAPESAGSLATLGQARRRLVVEAWIDRYLALFAQGCAFVMPFENRGDEVGVTLHHPHGQIYGFPVVPAPQANALAAFEAGYDLAAQVPAWRERFALAEAGGLMAYVPPFARFPYEVWISSLDGASGPWAFDETQADGFAHLLGEVTRCYDAFFGRETPYMMTLHAAPYGQDNAFQFTTQFYPMLRAPDRPKYLASVEQGTGIFTVDVLPEDAARQLRAAL